MARHKVVHIITRLDYGGSAQNTLLTVLGHDRTRFEPVVITGEAGREDAQGGRTATADNLRRLDKEQIRCHVLPSLVRRIDPLRDGLALCQLIRLLRAERPHLVHTHTSKAGVLGRLAAWWAGVPLVLHTPHGHVFYGHFGVVRSWLFLRIERWLARRTTALIALTEAERQDHLERGVGRADRVAVIPSGIDLARFRRARDRGKVTPVWFDCPADAFVVGSVGWLTAVKGHRFLVEAVARLKPECPRLHLVIVGSGEQREALARLAEEIGVADTVHLVGHREDIAQCLAGFDCFVFPSSNEGMGRALVEAMAAGLPVIASRVGGIPALIDDGINGLLVPPSDARALANALHRIVHDPAGARALGTRAARSIDDRYGIGAMVRKIEALYRDTVGDA